MPSNTASPRTTSRKTPNQERAKVTVDSILEATSRILVRDGVSAASTNRIAKEAGVCIGSLYQYFPSKEALIAALVDRHYGAIEEMFYARMSDTISRDPPRVQAATE